MAKTPTFALRVVRCHPRLRWIALGNLKELLDRSYFVSMRRQFCTIRSLYLGQRGVTRFGLAPSGFLDARRLLATVSTQESRRTMGILTAPSPCEALWLALPLTLLALFFAFFFAFFFALLELVGTGAIPCVSCRNSKYL